MKRIMAISALMLITMGVFAQAPVVNPFPKTITVTGSAEMEVVPDEIYVQITLKEYEKKGTKIELEKIKEEFLQRAKSIGIADANIAIASYDGYTDLWIRRRKQKKDEMYASIAYQIKFTNSKQIDELVSKLDDDATTNFQLVKTTHSKLNEFRKQLKINAIKAAKEKAGYLAAAIDETVGTAVSISEGSESGFEPYQYRLGAQSNVIYAKDATYESTPEVDFKKLKLRFEINVVFALK